MAKYFLIVIVFAFLHFPTVGNSFSNCWDCDENLFEILHNTDYGNRVAFTFRVDSTSVRHDYFFLNHGEVLNVYQGDFESTSVSLATSGSINSKALELKKDNVFFVLSGWYGGLRNTEDVSIKNKEQLSVDWNFSRNITGKKDSSYICNLWSQYQEDSKSTTNKEVEYHFEDGKISAEGMIKNGKPHGLWKYYFKNGNIYKTKFYQKGEPIKTVDEYYLNGQVKTKMDKKGAIIQRKKYYESGKLKSESIIDTINNFLVRRDDKLYHENGKLKKDYSYYSRIHKSDVVFYNEGLCTEYDNTGKVISKGKYYLGAKVGNWKEFNKRESKISKVKYEKIKAEKGGKTRVFYSNGHLRKEGMIDDKGQMQGIWKFYYFDGNLESMTLYKDDKKDGLSEKYDRKTGQKDGYITYSNGKKYGSFKGQMKGRKIYRNKDVECTGNYMGNKRTGLWISKIKNQIVERALYNEKGQLHGEFTQFQNGVKVLEAYYENGMMQGDFKQYYPDGTTKETGQYDEGHMIGEWVAYNEDGSEYARCIQSLPTTKELFSKECGYFHHRDKTFPKNDIKDRNKQEPWN